MPYTFIAGVDTVRGPAVLRMANRGGFIAHFGHQPLHLIKLSVTRLSLLSIAA